MTFRNPRRETESTHSDAPLGNSRCRASWKSALPASSSRLRQYSGPAFSFAVVDLVAEGVETEFALLAGANIFALHAVLFFVLHERSHNIVILSGARVRKANARIVEGSL